MVRKIAIVASVVVALAVIVLGYRHLMNTEKPKEGSVFPFSPDGFELVVRINRPGMWFDRNFTTQTHTMLLGSNATATEALGLLREFALTDLADTRAAYLLFQGNGHSWDWLLAKESDAEQLHSDAWQLTDTANYGALGLVYSYIRGDERLYVARTGGMWAMSHNRLMVENMLRTPPYSSGKSPKDAVHQLLTTADAGAVANVYINYTKAKLLLRSFVPAQVAQTLGGSFLMGVYDFNREGKELYLSGLSLPIPGTEPNTAQGEVAVHEVLPQTTISFQSEFTDYNSTSFRKRCALANVPYREALAQYLTGEQSSATLYDPTQPLVPAHVLVLAAKTESDAEDFAKSISGAVPAQGTYAAWPHAVDVCVPDAKPMPNYMVINRFIVLGSPAALVMVHSAYSGGQALAAWEPYRKLSEGGAQGAFRAGYLNPKYMRGFLQRQLTPAFFARAQATIDSLAYLNGMAIEFVQNKQFVYTSLHSQLKERSADTQAKAVWAIKLDTTLRSKPILLRNHYTKNNDVLVQDVANTVYLIDAQGQLLWKRTLSEPITSEVQQIDRYNNGKLQMFFSTPNYICLMDRQGEYVEGFPFKLPYPSTNGAVIYDYDRRLDFRILVACIDKHVYCFNIAGREIDGWAFGRAADEVQTPIQYFSYGEKDYLTFADRKQNYIVNRRGEDRVKLTQNFARRAQSSFTFDENAAENRPFFLGHDQLGTLYRCYTDGTVRPQRIADFSPNHYFMYEDFDGDAVPDYVFFDNNKLQVYNQLGKKIVEYSHPTNILSAPALYSFSRTDKRLGFYSAQEHKAYLVGNNGKISDGFPIPADNVFTIGKLMPNSGTLHMIVCAPGGYLYNYQVE